MKIKYLLYSIIFVCIYISVCSCDYQGAEKVSTSVNTDFDNSLNSDNYYDTHTDSLEITHLENMEIQALKDAYNIIYYYPEGGNYCTQLVRKKWGVWMLGEITHTDKNGIKVQMSDSSTDYEWVLNCGKNVESCVFRGGNHGDYGLADWNSEDSAKSNDKLLDITFYDAKSGEEIKIQEGEKVKAKGIRVLMHTNIYDGEYTKDNILINVEKNYLFNGETVVLKSKIHLAQDTFFKTSYTCMLPVMKKYGNYIRFYNADGSIKTVKTPINGNSNYGNNFSDYNIAPKVTVFGEHSPEYQMTVQIYNPETQFLNSVYYTRLWDMNSTSNKIYFSAFSDTPTMVEKGCEWEYTSSWSFSYQPDFSFSENVDLLLGFE